MRPPSKVKVGAAMSGRHLGKRLAQELRTQGNKFVTYPYDTRQGRETPATPAKLQNQSSILFRDQHTTSFGARELRTLSREKAANRPKAHSFYAYFTDPIYYADVDIRFPGVYRRERLAISSVSRLLKKKTMFYPNP